MQTPRFKNVSCSQCGVDFGPGEHGFSHCDNHQGMSMQTNDSGHVAGGKTGLIPDYSSEPTAETDTGGPAFPLMESPSGQFPAHSGMDLRDYFAAKAMQAYVTQELIHCKSGQTVDHAIAEMAYDVADAMLKARAA